MRNLRTASILTLLLLCLFSSPLILSAQSQTPSGNLTVDLGPDRAYCFDQVLLLTVPKRQGFTYQWEDGSNYSDHLVTKPGTYWITATSPYQSFTDTVTITAENCECIVWMPNNMTPNCDCLNDVFIPQTTCPISAYKLVIFDRWGQQLFETEDLSEGWSADYEDHPVPDGTYYWVLNYTTPEGKIVDRRGHLMVLR